MNLTTEQKVLIEAGLYVAGEDGLTGLKRELKEEIGIDLKICELIDADSVKLNWEYNGELLDWHHIGIFYKVLSYDNNIKENIEIDNRNNDSFGAVSLDINNLKKEELSQLAILELEKLGIKLI